MGQYMDKNISFKMLMSFALPSILAMIFTGIYTTVDGAFVSKLISPDALSAVNIVWPIITLAFAIGAMMGSGGSAIVAKKMGEGKEIEAKRDFSFIFIFAITISILLVIFCFIFFDQIISFLGADDTLRKYCEDYAFYTLIFFPFCVLSFIIYSFLIAAGKSTLGFIFSLIGGISNIILDYLFMGPLQMGIKGAAIATGIGYMITSILALIVFFIPKENGLYFLKPRFDYEVIFKTMSNGSSEMVTNLATGVVTLMLNNTLMTMVGPKGVSAITVILYAQSILSSIYFGYSMGIAPLVSFNYGKNEVKRLHKINKLSLISIAITSGVTFILAISLSPYLVKLLIDSDKYLDVFEMANYGFKIASFSFLFMGFNVYASALFTALNNGKISALISFLRTLVFMSGCIIILPMIFDLDGVWLSLCGAELLSLCVVIPCLIIYKRKYHY